MNIALWILQALLAVHNAVGAFWKFSNSEQAVPSLKAIPHGVWLTMSIIELVLCLGLVVPPLYQPLAFLVPVAAACFAAEMLALCGVALASGKPNYGQMVYWLVVAAVAAFIAYGRWVLAPF